MYLVLCGWSEGTMTPFSSRYLSPTGPTLFCVNGQKGLWHRFHPGISHPLDLPCFVWMVRRDYDTVFIQVSLTHCTYLVLCGWSEGTMTLFSSRYLSPTVPTLFCVDGQKGLWHRFHPGISQDTGPTLFCVDGQKGLWHHFHPGISRPLDLPCFVWMVRRDYDTIFIQVSLGHWTYLVLCGWSEGTMTPFSSRYLSGWNFHGSFQYRWSWFKFQTLHQTCEIKQEDVDNLIKPYITMKDNSLVFSLIFGKIFAESCMKNKEIWPISWVHQWLVYNSWFILRSLKAGDLELRWNSHKIQWEIQGFPRQPQRWGVDNIFAKLSARK